MSDADDWESSTMFLGEEHIPKIQPIAERNIGRTILHMSPDEKPGEFCQCIHCPTCTKHVQIPTSVSCWQRMSKWQPWPVRMA